MVVTREGLVRRAVGLAVFTVVWNVVEGIVAIAAALAAGSQALLGFGLDSAIESISASILLWRLFAERRAPERDGSTARDRPRPAARRFLRRHGTIGIGEEHIAQPDRVA